MNIITQIRSSVYNPEFYANLRQEKGSYSAKYYLKFALILSLVATALLSIKAVPMVKAFVSEFGQKVVEQFPAELVLTVTDNKVSVNVPEPYYIAMPEELTKHNESNGYADTSRLGSDNNKANLLVIDTKSTFSIDKYKEYDTPAWLTVDSLVMQDNKGIRIVPLAEVPNLTIDRAKLTEWTSMIKPGPINDAVNYILPVIIFLAMLMFLASKLVYLLFGALVIWLVGRLAGWELTYGKSYQMGLHAITLPIVLFGLLMIGNIWYPFKLSFTLVLLATIAINLPRAKT